MIYRLQVRVQAKRDLRQAAKWYEQRLSGLGREFVSEIEAVIERTQQNQLLYQPIYREVRRAIAHRFPYGIFYRIDQQDIIVLRSCTFIVRYRRGRTAFDAELLGGAAKRTDARYARDQADFTERTEVGRLCL